MVNNKSILTDKSIHMLQVIPEHIVIRPCSTLYSFAFSALSYILCCILHEVGDGRPLSALKVDLFIAQLEAWFDILPAELLLPMDQKTQNLDMSATQHIVAIASEMQKAQLVKIL